MADSQPAVRATLMSAKPGLFGPTGLRLAWAYGRHELLYVCWALMEVALIAPAALALLPWTYFWPMLLFSAWLLLILLVPFNLSRVMTIATVPLARQRRIILGAFLLALFFTFRSLIYDPASAADLSWIGAVADRAISQPARLWQRELPLFTLLALLWWRGLVLARRHVSVSEVGFRMRLGSLLLAPLVVILAQIPNAPHPLPFVMLFFLAALMAIALTRAEEVSRQNNTAVGLNARWILTVLLTSVGIVIVAATFGLALGGRGLQQALQWLSPLWNALALGGMVVVTTSTYLLLWLLTPLQWALRALFALLADLGVDSLPELEPLPPELTDPNVDQLILDLGDPQSALFLWANRAAVILVVFVGLLILYFALRRYFLQRAMAVGSSALAPAADPGERGPLGSGLLRRFNLWRRWRAAATVRQLYRTMCVEAAARGYPRAESETPYEYLSALARAWPGATRDTGLLTDAYVRVRYGEIPESAQELEALRQAWRRLSQAPEPES